jgi:hypothetical protein
VNAGVGPPGANQIHRMVGHFRHGLGQLLLNRAHATFLELPAVEGTTIVLEYEGYPAIADGIICCQGLRGKKQVLIRNMKFRNTKRRLRAGALPLQEGL